MRHVLILCIFTFLSVGCAIPTRNVDRSVDNAVEKAERLIDKAKADTEESLRNARREYEQALAKTRAEVDEVRKQASADLKQLQLEFDKELAEVNRKAEERIEQMRSSAAELIKQSDQAVQARIDQLFLELRLFIKETLIQIRELIQPVLTLADKLGGSVEAANQGMATATLAVSKITDKTAEVMTNVNLTIVEVKNALLKIQGKNPDGTSTDLPGWLGLIGSLLIMANRYLDKKNQGDRWKETELKDLLKQELAEQLKSGALDEHIKARLSVIQGSKPNGS
jgi:hypothetical protein